MSEIPKDRRFTPSHEWALKSGDQIHVGITDFAVQELGDLVFIDLPEVGTAVTAGEPFGEIESVKAVSELCAPVSGTISKVDNDLEDSLENLAESPYKDGWLIHIDPSEPGEFTQLLTHTDYARKLSEEE